MPDSKPFPPAEPPGPASRPPDGYVPSESGAGEEDPGASMDVVKEQSGVGEDESLTESTPQDSERSEAGAHRLNKG